MWRLWGLYPIGAQGQKEPGGLSPPEDNDILSFQARIHTHTRARTHTQTHTHTHFLTES